MSETAMNADSTIGTRSGPLTCVPLGSLLLALAAAAIVAGVAIEPLAALAVAGGVCFLAAYFYRRDWLLGGIFFVLIFQNLAYERLLPVDQQLALGVKHADDMLIGFFFIALSHPPPSEVIRR